MEGIFRGALHFSALALLSEQVIYFIAKNGWVTLIVEKQFYFDIYLSLCLPHLKKKYDTCVKAFSEDYWEILSNYSQKLLGLGPDEQTNKHTVTLYFF